MSNNGHLTTPEAAELLGVSGRRVLQMGAEGKLSDTGKFADHFRLWKRAEVEALRLVRAGYAVCQRCGCVEDVQGGLCWLCRLEERQPWHRRPIAQTRVGAWVRSGKLVME